MVFTEEREAVWSFQCGIWFIINDRCYALFHVSTNGAETDLVSRQSEDEM